jgi:hypothetical protein
MRDNTELDALAVAITSRKVNHVLDADVRDFFGSPLLLPLPCGLPYAVQRLGHALPGLSRPGRTTGLPSFLGLI